MPNIIIETFSKVDENAKITGIAALPRISRNNRLYLKSELAKADGLRVPLNWEHTDKEIGYVTYNYNPELEQLYYEGEITDPVTAVMAKNKTLFTSIEAEPISVTSQCFTTKDCMEVPLGLHNWKLALTETPGIPETTVKVYESFKRKVTEDCYGDCIAHKKDSGKPIDDQAKAICHSECEKESNELKNKVEQLEKQVFDLTHCQKCGGTRKK